MNPSVRLGPLSDPAGKLLSNDLDKAEIFNKFFQSVFTTDDNTIPVFDRRTAATMDMPVFSPDEVRMALLKSKNSSSCEPDGCPSKVLKLFPELCIPLADIFNMSLR